MKACHPCCRWHASNWVLVHITVMHLDAMRRSLKNPDPDLKVLEQYEQLMAKGALKKCKIRLEPESESESEVSLHLQFTLQIPPRLHSVQGSPPDLPGQLPCVSRPSRRKSRCKF